MLCSHRFPSLLSFFFFFLFPLDYKSSFLQPSIPLPPPFQVLRLAELLWNVWRVKGKRWRGMPFPEFFTFYSLPPPGQRWSNARNSHTEFSILTFMGERGSATTHILFYHTAISLFGNKLTVHTLQCCGAGANILVSRSCFCLRRLRLHLLGKQNRKVFFLYRIKGRLSREKL